jgi:uncharacterized protein (DUF2235 family)
MKRRIIVCCDGTWQDLNCKYPTNVVKIAQAIKPVSSDGIQQIVYYDAGIGTRVVGEKGSVTDALVKLGGGGIALGIDNKIEAIYRFLCLNYQRLEDGLEPDDLYLIGFSRGAYIVRCLAGLIYNSGLPKRRHIRKIPEAYEIYRDKKSKSMEPDGATSTKFRKSYGERIPVKALCCWDTVASVGIPNLIPGIELDNMFNERYGFHDTKINSDIENAFHALAIDEDRKVFNCTLMQPADSYKTNLHQVWFPGGHGCVGGGSKDERGLSDGALEWMLEMTESLGLCVERSSIEYSIKSEQEKYGVHPVYSSPFKISKSPFGHKLREIPVSLDVQRELHESTKQRWRDAQCCYRPSNLEKVVLGRLDNQVLP